MRYKFPSSGSNISAGSLSSMIDIIFLLIIFFVVTASFDREQIDSKVTLPQVCSAAIKSLPPDCLMLNVLADGSVKIGLEHLTASDVSKKLAASMRNMKTTPNTVLIINGDRDDPTPRYIHFSTGFTPSGSMARQLKLSSRQNDWLPFRRSDPSFDMRQTNRLP